MMMFKGVELPDYGIIYEIDEDGLVLHGGGDGYNDGGSESDEETYQQAREIAAKLGKVITDARLAWYGWSEYTPDPGDVSIFEWRNA